MLGFHPRLAPVKVGVFPLVKKDGMPEKADDIMQQFLGEGIEPRLFLVRNPGRLPPAWIVSRAEVCPPGEEGRAQGPAESSAAPVMARAHARFHRTQVPGTAP